VCIVGTRKPGEMTTKIKYGGTDFPVFPLLPLVVRSLVERDFSPLTKAQKGITVSRR